MLHAMSVSDCHFVRAIRDYLNKWIFILDKQLWLKLPWSFHSFQDDLRQIDFCQKFETQPKARQLQDLGYFVLQLKRKNRNFQQTKEVEVESAKGDT